MKFIFTGQRIQCGKLLIPSQSRNLNDINLAVADTNYVPMYPITTDKKFSYINKMKMIDK